MYTYSMFGGYGLYLLFSLPALLLGLWAQMKVKSAFSHFSRVKNYNGYTGEQVARKMLDSNGLHNVKVEETKGTLSDHYDPSKKILRLSPEVYRTPSVAAAGIAAHEAGHALQDAQGYAMLNIRSLMVPSVQIGSWLGPIIFIIGLMLSEQLAWIGLILFSATAVFALVTLPVEFNASNRAKAFLTDSGLLVRQEMGGINKVLDAAALTYVAAAIQAISTVLYYAFILLVNQRDR